MKQRVITAIGIGIVVIPIMLLSKYIVYPIFLGIISAIAAWEMLRVFGFDKRFEISLPAYAVSGLLPVFAHDYFTGGNTRSYILVEGIVMFAFLLYLAVVCVIGKEIVIRRNEERSDDGKQKILGFTDVAAVFMSVSYIAVSFTSMALTRYMKNGSYTFVLVFIAAWVCDSFAYFTGRFFGKHKLAPHLSPKKTIEGSIGGIFFAILGCMLYGLVIEKAVGIGANYIVLATIGLLLSIVSQIGDLWASLIKREYGVKDYSQMMPGHGGIMDRFDSIIAISTILMAVCMVCPPFN
jgi:phosphatidate cytidylyltransferase